MRTETKSLCLKSKVLIDMAAKPNEVTKIKQYQKFGIKSKPSNLSDETILEIRALSEFGHWNYSMLMEKYQLDRKAISRCCEYYSKCGLIPNKNNLPDWA